AERGIEKYYVLSSSPNPTSIESADASTLKQPEPSADASLTTGAGAGLATVPDQTLETISKTITQPE
ncbi:MAG: hypothetical protein K8963_09715, partial [Proteobacteria bacterium]|nr:hypothetical protein [Pseudomonadota bacterium]